MESDIAQSREGFNNHKVQRNKLHDERKYVYLFLHSLYFFWKKEGILLDRRKNTKKVEDGVSSLAKAEGRKKHVLFLTLQSRGNVAYDFKLLSCRSLWGKENELTAEIDKLRAEVEKAKRSLDHAIPGVSDPSF